MSLQKKPEPPPWALDQDKLMSRFNAIRGDISSLKTVVEDVAAIMPQIKYLLEREQKRRVIGEFLSSWANLILKTSAIIGAITIVSAAFKKEIKIFLGIL